MQTIVTFASDEDLQADQVGSKALSLLAMTREGLPVPPGVVLTVRFFEPWSDALEATPEWNLLQVATGEDLVRATIELQAACRNLPFTPTQREGLERALSFFRASSEPGLLAVRSSSPEEDLEGASFAGGYETTLGVAREGLDLEEAIRKSFASGVDARVVLYKREHKIPTDRLRIAVIVQEQLDATSAGVAFSLNPVNNCFDEAVVTANYGLGESVVSGAVTPDVYVVDKVNHNILETKIGSKEVVITLEPGGGTSERAGTRQEQPCIAADEVLQIVDLLAQVEGLYRKPVDIEWAVAGGKLYLLQARPITTYLPLPEEMVTAPGAQKYLYADSTLIEQGLQEPLSVLGADFLTYVLRQNSGPFGGDMTGPDGMAFTAGGRYYMHLSNAMKFGMGNAALAPGSIGDSTVKAILDSIDLAEYTPAELPAKMQAIRRKMPFATAPLLVQAAIAFLFPKAYARRYRAALPKQLELLRAPAADGVPMRERADRLTRVLRFFFIDYGAPMMIAALLAQSRIKGLFQHEGVEVRDHLVNLGVSLPGNKTAEMGELMYALAASEEIECCASAEEFIAALQGGRLPDRFAQTWARFMEEFGARCPGEIDIATPRPKEQPGHFFEQLRGMSLAVRARAGVGSFFEEARAKREAAYRELRAVARRGGWFKARRLDWYYGIWVTLGGFRETPKHYVVEVIDRLRNTALDMADAFVAQGRLDHREQIFDLTIDDIDRAVLDRTLDLRSLAQERTSLIKRIKRSKVVARVIDSRGKVYYPPRSVGDGDLTGVPISPGVVQGRAKVFLHATDKQLPPGEILVARATDPGWTPLFINAGGIVLEIGGALQHGAVVAREYGIPCVSGLDGATGKIKDGQLLEVDGSNGVVRILDGPDEVRQGVAQGGEVRSDG